MGGGMYRSGTEVHGNPTSAAGFTFFFFECRTSSPIRILPTAAVLYFIAKRICANDNTTNTYLLNPVKWQ